MSAVAEAPRLDPPGPPKFYMLWNLPRMRHNMLDVFGDMIHSHGHISMTRIHGGRRLYVTTEPELIRDILVTNPQNFHKDRGLNLAKVVLGEGLLTSEAPFHRRQRKLSAPAFHRQRIANYAETMAAYAQRTADGWSDGSRVDLDQEMMRLTLAVVAKTLYDADIENEADEIGEALSLVMGMFPRIMNPFAEILLRLPIPSTRQFLAARDRLDATIYRMIRERRASGEDRGDLLSMLLAAQDEDDGTGMTDQQVRDEAITIFLAGHETTANALTWAWYLLSQHPEVEARLHAEIDEHFDAERPVECVPKLKYARQVIAETMRLYPPAHTIARRVLEEYQLGPYTVPPGSTIIMSIYYVQRDPRFWDDPEKFDPDRWAVENEQRPKFAYFPFGGGPRVCIGEQFAWMEAVLMLAVLARQWRARLVPGHPIDIRPLITLRPRHGMAMTLERR